MKQYFLVIFLIYSAFAAPNSIEKEENGNEIEIKAAQFMPMMNPMLMGMGGMNPMMMGMGQCGRCSCMGCSIPWMCLPVCNPCCCNSTCNDQTTTEKPTEAPVPVFPDMHGPEDGTPIWLLPDNIPERNFPQFPIRNSPRFEPDNFYPPDIIVRL